MTEVQVAAAAFDSELSKQLSCLLPTPQQHQHDLVKEHQRGTLKLRELIEYYVKKQIPPHAFGPRLLAAGAELVSRYEYDLAIYCFSHLAGLNLPAAWELSKLDAEAKLSLHVQALYGLYSSQAAKAYQRDPHLSHEDTVQAVKTALKGLQTTCMQVLPIEKLYWLVHNAAVHLQEVAAPLVTAGHYESALPYYIFAAKALASHLQLSGTQYLPYRCQMYAAAAHCYYAVIRSSSDSAAAAASATAADASSKAATGSKLAQNNVSSPTDGISMANKAQQLMQDGLSELDSIINAQALDPVPPPGAVTAALQEARSHLLLLKVWLSTAGAPAAGAEAQQATVSKDDILEVLKPLQSEEAKLAAVSGLLMADIGSSSQQPLRQRQLPPNLLPVLDAAVELAKPLLMLSNNEAEDSNSSNDADQGSSDITSKAAIAISEDLHISLLRIAYTYNQQELVQKLLAAAQVRLFPHNTAAGHSENCLWALTAVLKNVQQLEQGTGDASICQLAVCLKQHSRPLAGQLPGIVAAAALKLHAAAERLLQGCFSQCDGQVDTVLLVLGGLHEALQQCGCDDGVLRGSVAIRLALLLEQRGELHQASTTIQEGLAAIEAARCDALSQLKAAADEHVRWITGSRTQANEATATLLAGMTPTEQELACIHADALLVQQRLQLSAGLQEVIAETAAKQQQLIASTVRRDKQSAIFGTRTDKEKRLDEAAIEAAGKQPSSAAVCERQLMLNCAKNSYQRALLLTQIAAYQPDVARQAALLQEACDLLIAAHDSEADLFVKQQPSAASQRISSDHGSLLQPKILCRTSNSVTLTNHPVSVKGHKQPMSFAAYCKPTGAGVGLSINSTAMEYPGSGVKVPLGSRVTIDGLQSNETYVFAIAVYDERGALMGDLGPSTLSILIALPLPLYICWAHVLLTATQLQQWAPAKRAASILLPRFITTSPARALWQEHPMDRHRLQLQQVLAAPAPLLRLLVLATYSYAQEQGQKLHAQVLHGSKSKQVGVAAAESTAGKLAGTAASRALLLQCSKSQVPVQVALLETCKKVMAAMQIAGVIGDEMLVEEGALRAYNLLLPLLQQRDITPLMHQALSSLHLALTAVNDTAPSSIQGHNKQRETAARATAALSYWLVRLSAPFHPDLAAGGLAGAAARGRGNTPLQPIAAFARLDSALLKALAPPAASELPSPEAAVALSGRRTARVSTTASASASKASKGGKQGPVAGADAVPAVSAVVGAAQPAAHEGSIEVAAAHDLVRQHPNSAAWDLPARLQDTTDLAGQVLPMLNRAGALANCWPLLSSEDARSHKRWLPLCVMVMEAAAKQHGPALMLAMSTFKVSGIQRFNLGLGLAADELTPYSISSTPGLLAAAAVAGELVSAVMQHVRLAARVPQLLEWSTTPCWRVEAADAALAASGYVLGAQGTAAEPAAPQFTAGTAEVEKSAALAVWEQQKSELLAKERKRLAAALFLQQRLPVLLKRRRKIMGNRQQLAKWAPWLAHLHRLLAGLAAESVTILAGFATPPAAPVTASATEAEESELFTAQCPPAGPPEAEGPAAADSRSGSTVGPSGPGMSTQQQEKGHTPRSARGDGKGPAGKYQRPEGASTTQHMHQLSIQTLQQFAQAATLASQAGPDAWQELFNSCKQFWNVSRFLVNHQPGLTLPTAAVQWSQALLPAPKVPPLAAEVAQQLAPAAVDATAAKGKAAALAGEKKASDKNAAVAAERKGTGGTVGSKGGKAGLVDAAVPTRYTLIPEARGASVASALSAIAEALLAVLHQLRAGAVWYPKLVPLPPSTASSAGSTTEATAVNSAAARQTGKKGPPGQGRPISACSHATASTGGAATEFSLGSDAVVARWHTGRPIDVVGLTRLVMVVLKVLHKMERWHKVMDIGCRWLDICEGSADALLLPFLLSVAPKVGDTAEVCMLSAAHQALIRDKNTAFDALDKVRALVSDRLTERPFLSQQLGNTHKAAQKATQAARLGDMASHSSHDQAKPAAGTLGPEPSGFSVATIRSKRAVANQVLLPAEYEKAVELLSKRGEKGHMILALNELGDVHAHFGNWSAAGDAWGAALDALLGPYQVVNSWTTKLDLGSWQQLLAKYGAHGLLTTGTLLGKLARYIYPCHLNSRLSCARLAAELLPAVFAADITHPQRPVDCAIYTPVEIWPGVDLFDDPYRCNAPDLVACLETLSAVLLEHHLCVQLLPLVSLWEHLALHVVHQTSSVLLARITRVKALAHLGLLAEGGDVLQGLMQGKNLPGTLLHGPQPLLGPDGMDVALHNVANGTAASPNTKAAAAVTEAQASTAAPPHFNASKWPGHAANASFLELVCNAALQPCIADVYGPWLCGQLSLARASWLAAAGGTANCWRNTDPSSFAVTNNSLGGSTDSKNSGSNPATGNNGSSTTAHHTAAVASKEATTTAVPATAPDAVETRLLDRAAELVHGVVASSRRAAGLPTLPGSFNWDQDSDLIADATNSKKSTSPSKGGKSGKTATGAKGKAVKGAPKYTTSHAVPNRGCVVGSEDFAGMQTREQALLQQQHQQLVVEGLMLLTKVQLLQWMPSQAVQLSMAAASVIVSATAVAEGSMSNAGQQQWSNMPTSTGSALSRPDYVDRAAIKPSTWLAARCQLATVLLHLKHHRACVAVANKALLDCGGVGDVLWAAQLQQVKADALAAQGDAAEALNVMRQALTKLQQLSLCGPQLLSLQLDCAVLCDELGARGEVDSLAGAALTTSSTVAEQAGLQEMLDHPELLNLYLAATPAHVSALVLAATSATRKRQLATAEKLLRQAVVLLGCMRSLPTQHAEVAVQLAQVLRAQAALKLPATDLVVNSKGSMMAAGAVRSLQSGCAAAELVAGPAGTDAGPVLRQGLDLQQQRLQEASELLAQAAKILVTDGGSHPLMVRAALLELAAVELYKFKASDHNAGTQDVDNSRATALRKLLAALQAAHTTAGHIRVLYLTSHQLTPVNSPNSNLPDWLLEWLKGQEHLQATLQQQSAAEAASASSAAGKPAHSRAAKKDHPHQVQGQSLLADREAADAAPVPDATLGRLAVCYYVQQLTAAADGLPGVEQRQTCAAQALHMQLALARACPRLLSDACWTQVPLIGAESTGPAGDTAATPPSGGVFVQWYRQSCCWQVPGSWRSDGCLPPVSSNTCITRDLLHRLPAPPAYASCLYVVSAPASITDGVDQQVQSQTTRLLVGEVVVSVERLKRMQLQVKSLRRHLEAPGLPTDLFGAAAPGVKELAATKHSVECMLAGINEEDMGAAPAELPIMSASAAATHMIANNASVVTAAKPTTAVIGKTGGASGSSGQHAGQKQLPGGFTAATGSTDTENALLDWSNVSTWMQIEGLLDVEDGCQCMCQGLAAWLHEVLQQQQQQQQQQQAIECGSL